MAGYMDPYGRSRQPQRRMPTLEDYQALAQAYQKLQQQQEETAARLADLDSRTAEEQTRIKHLEQELAVKDEALTRQGQALKETESELLWTRAALEQQQQATADAEEESWQERFQRLQADFDNVRKRADQRFNTELTTARHQILLDMLPLADHLDMALQHAAGLDGAATQTFVDNIKATRQAFLDTLKRYGVTRMDAETAPFDPNCHEAIGQIPADDVPAHHVAQVIQAGYTEGDKLLRPARVLVSAGPSGPTVDAAAAGGDDGI